MRRTAALLTLGAGLLLAVVAIVFGTTSLVSLLWLRTEEQVLLSEFSSEGDSVVVENGCGRIALVEGDEGEVRTSAEIRYTFSKPSVASEAEDGVVRVRVNCPAFTLGTGGSVTLTVSVPPGAGVAADSTAGGVEVEGLSGPLTLRSSAGSIRGEALGSASLDADTSAGSVTLSFATAPELVRAHTSAGSVTVLVPDDDTTYRVDASTSAGSETVAVRSDPASDRSIEVSSSAGSILVGYVE